MTRDTPKKRRHQAQGAAYLPVPQLCDGCLGGGGSGLANHLLHVQMRRLHAEGCLFNFGWPLGGGRGVASVDRNLNESGWCPDNDTPEPFPLKPEGKSSSRHGVLPYHLVARRRSTIQRPSLPSVVAAPIELCHLFDLNYHDLIDASNEPS